MNPGIKEKSREPGNLTSALACEIFALASFCYRFRTLRWERDRLCIVAAAEKFFQPYVQTNEQVAASHFLDFEFGFSCFPVAPGNWNDCPGVTANDRLERNLDRKIEMWSNEWSTSIDNRLSIGFKRVRCVVQINVEQELQEFIRRSIDDEF